MKMLLPAFIALLSLLPLPALAHPHAWIDVEVHALADETGKLTGLRQVWYFDDAYSAFTLEGLKRLNGGEVPQAALDDLAAENLTNLADYSWFTDLKVDGRRQAFAMPDRFSQVFTDGRLVMTFDLLLQQPVNPDGASWQIYDPVYYIELLYKEMATPLTLANSLSCSATIEEPNPTEEMVIQATALGPDEVAEDGLGALFAQKATLACP